MCLRAQAKSKFSFFFLELSWEYLETVRNVSGLYIRTLYTGMYTGTLMQLFLVL